MFEASLGLLGVLAFFGVVAFVAFNHKENVEKDISDRDAVIFCIWLVVMMLIAAYLYKELM